MLVILPFEKTFYDKWNYNVIYVGHPLLDAIDGLPQPELHYEKRVIALLPGSRTQEIKAMLPLMLAMVPKFPDYEFVIAKAPSQEDSFYDEIIGSTKVTAVKSRTYELLKVAHAALVTSGTATLETALFNVPQVVCYKASAISYAIAKQLVKVKYISLVNLILDKPAVTELIQTDFNENNLEKELDLILHEKRDSILNEYKILRELLGSKGASDRAAEAIINKYLK
jgi:lipid-A-disaccharide synthase